MYAMSRKYMITTMNKNKHHEIKNIFLKNMCVSHMHFTSVC
jgi:inosine/xanthosine triphosphate pyrophosphatase family protein